MTSFGRAAASLGALLLALPAHAGNRSAGPVACRELRQSSDPSYRGPCMSPDPIAFFPAAGANAAVMVSNFALAFPGAGSAPWEYVCDDLYGRPTPERIRRSPNGELLLPTTLGLQITRDGCSFEQATGPIAADVVFDVAVDPKNPATVFALVGTPRTLQRSADGGRSFAPVFTFPDGLLLSRVIVPPGRNKEVYVLGRGRGSATPLGVSTDDGASFAMRDAATGATSPIRTSFEMQATHPSDPATLYFTIIESDGDELWRTTDAGLTTTRILKVKDTEALGGMAFGATPAVIYVGGRTLYPELSSPAGHFYVSHDAGATWQPPVTIATNGPQITCLAAAGNDIYACSMGAVATEGVMVSASSDEGKTWRPISRLGDLNTPKACTRGSCLPVSTWLCDTYTTCAAGQIPSGMAPNPDAGADGGSGGRADGGVTLPPVPRDDGGCGVGGRGAGATGAALSALFLLVRAVRRRRR
jgi:photosystem II stability/assembly factor-like uncharacterized protein